MASTKPRNDRRAKLDEWRRSRATDGGGQPPSSAPSPSKYRASNKAPSSSARHNDYSLEQRSEPTIEIPPPPQPRPSSAPSSVDLEDDNLSALERYRLRKKRQGGGGGGGQSQPMMPPTHRSNSSAEQHSVGTPTRGRKPPPHPPSQSSTSHAEEEETTMTIGHGSYSMGTPSRRGKSRSRVASSPSLGGARRVRRRTSLAPSDMQHQQSSEQPRKSKPLLPPSYPSSNERSHDKFEVEESQQQRPLSSERELVIEQQQQQPTHAAAFSQESIESVNSSGCRRKQLAAVAMQAATATAISARSHGGNRSYSSGCSNICDGVDSS